MCIMSKISIFLLFSLSCSNVMFTQAAENDSIQTGINENSASLTNKIDGNNPDPIASSLNDDENAFRAKRNEDGGSSSLTGILNTVFSKKLKIFGSLSGVSGSSSNSGKHLDGKPAPPPQPLDWAAIKKSIKSSIWQALKAITGGVIALNGQLVRVKGHLVAAKGHFIATKGDKIAKVGENLATHAFPPAHINTDAANEDRVDDSSAAESSTTSTEGDTQSPSAGGSVVSALEDESERQRYNLKEFYHPVRYIKGSRVYAKRSAPMYDYTRIFEQKDKLLKKM